MLHDADCSHGANLSKASWLPLSCSITYKGFFISLLPQLSSFSLSFIRMKSPISSHIRHCRKLLPLKSIKNQSKTGTNDSQQYPQYPALLNASNLVHMAIQSGNSWPEVMVIAAARPVNRMGAELCEKDPPLCKLSPKLRFPNWLLQLTHCGLLGTVGGEHRETVWFAATKMIYRIQYFNVVKWHCT